MPFIKPPPMQIATSFSGLPPTGTWYPSIRKRRSMPDILKSMIRNAKRKYK